MCVLRMYRTNTAQESHSPVNYQLQEYLYGLQVIIEAVLTCKIYVEMGSFEGKGAKKQKG